MMKQGLKLIGALALLSLTACAHTVEEHEYVYQPEQPVMEELFPSAEELVRQDEDQADLKKRIHKFNAFLLEDDCQGAEREARKAWQDYSTENKEMEGDMLTAICLCHLAIDGDIDRFSRCSQELAELTEDWRFLDRECQVVLELQPYFDQQQNSAGRDSRIDAFINQSLKNTFGNNE